TFGLEVGNPAVISGTRRSEIFVEQIIETLGEIRTHERMLAGVCQTIDEGLENSRARGAIVRAIPPLRQGRDGLVTGEQIGICQKREKGLPHLYPVIHAVELVGEDTRGRAPYRGIRRSQSGAN